MKVDILQLGFLATNCSIVYDENGDAAVIDPADRCDAILAQLAEKKLTCRAILITHGHPDHTGALAALKEATGATVCVGEADEYRLPMKADRLLQDADTVQVGKLQFTVIATPGHTEGGVCYLLEDVLFAGDTLFCESVGRTDFPGGDTAVLMQSLQKLKALPYEDLHVIPGHHEFTTLAHERAYNPYLR
ncbi:MAG: MBL fold metallo-hydrolase [Oscillospiraceae bacterium]|nr:MBL fold metallo-hydrolase [Oscillospiraceae bacterium]